MRDREGVKAVWRLQWVRICLCFCLLWAGVYASGYAQMSQKLTRENYQLDKANTRQLGLVVDNLSFFKNNEFGGEVMKGYSLPGVRLIPRITYQPLSNIRLEAGAYGIWYSGANKYPCYSYQDISEWKGRQYQKGLHLLPFFRGQIAIGGLNVVLGNIYGGTNHRLILPLYNPELNLTSDPESGLQILYDAPRFHLDAWVDWQSFIFEHDSHQEAFVAGVSAEVKYNSPSAQWHVYSPVQFTAQHRGGEQDVTDAGVQTMMNVAAGVGVIWNSNRKFLKSLTWEMDGLAYFQQAGTLWPNDRGAGWYTKVDACVSEQLHFQAGYFVCDDFISLLGSPYFGAVSTKHENSRFEGNSGVLHLAADYSRSFSGRYVLGFKGEVFRTAGRNLVRPDGTVDTVSSNLSFSLGVYLRLSPSFLLKAF